MPKGKQQGVGQSFVSMLYHVIIVDFTVEQNKNSCQIQFLSFLGVINVPVETVRAAECQNSFL